MDDQRIERALREGPPDEAAYEPRVGRNLARTSHAPVSDAAESAFTARMDRRDVRVHGRSGGSRYPAAIAAVLVIAIAGLALRVWEGPAAGRSPSPVAGDLLARIRAAGVIEVVVSNEAPQVAGVGGTFVGYDVDVANAIASRLGLRAEVTPMAPRAILTPSAPWDLGFPSAEMTAPLGFVQTAPYYAWPSWLVVDAGSDLSEPAQLAGQPICVVVGSAGSSWIAGDLASGSQAVPVPAGVTIVTRPDDAGCLVAIENGRAMGAVTATLLDSDLAGRGVKAIGTGPVVIQNRRGVIGDSAPDSDSFAAAVDDAIGGLLASGELAELSRRAFGGRDLTEGIIR